MSAERPLVSISPIRVIEVLCAAAALAAVGWVVVEFYRQKEFHGEVRRIAGVIQSLETRRPEGVSKEFWEAGVTWTGIAHANICFSRSHVPTPAVYRFGRQLDERLKQPLDRNFFEWTWDRLAETSPHGADYAGRFRIMMHEAMAATKTSRSR